MKKVVVVAGMGVALCSAIAFADPDPTRVPLENAAANVSAKSAENPDNKGLANATRHIVIENIPRQQAKRENHPPGQQKKEANAADKGGAGQDKGADRAQVADRVDRVERVEKVERPERPERPEKPDRPERSARAGVDRPVPPGHNK